MEAKYPKISLLIQGPCLDKGKLDFLDAIEYYKTLFPNIVLSTYTEHLEQNPELLDICSEHGIKVVLQTIDIGDVINTHGIYYQTYSTNYGLKSIFTRYVIKHRTDERYSNLELLIDKFLQDDSKYVTGGSMFGTKSWFEYCAADHLVICRTDNLSETMQMTLDQLNSGYWEGGPEIMYTKNFLRVVTRVDGKNHDHLMRKYIDFLPDKYMEPFVIRMNSDNKVWRTAEDLGPVKNSLETVEDILTAPYPVFNFQ